MVVLSERAINFLKNDPHRLEIHPYDPRWIDECEEAGWEAFPPVRKFFDLYGGWNISGYFLFVPGIPEENMINPLQTWMKITSRKLFPLCSGYELGYFIDDSERVYEVDEESCMRILKVGDSIERAFDILLLHDQIKPGYQLPNNHKGEKFDFWRPNSDFPPPFRYQVYEKSPIDQQWHWRTVPLEELQRN
jgi:hypothetical protein